MTSAERWGGRLIRPDASPTPLLAIVCRRTGVIVTAVTVWWRSP